MEENTNIDVVEEIEENNLWSSEYAKAQVNVLDDVPQSYSHQRNLELDQTRYIAKTWDHEFMNLEVVKWLSKVYAFYEEGHAIMHCPFVPFHIRTGIARHAEL